MLNCFDVANFFICATDDAHGGDFITNLKLQKLLYYAQGFNLALYAQPLFQEGLEAWMYGPVVPIAYHHYKNFGNHPLLLPEDFNRDVFDRSVLGLLNEVQNTYGQYSAWKLAQMTHEEDPWKNAVNGSKKITHEALAVYFKTQLTD